MTHDPLCRHTNVLPECCTLCDLIARVREDEATRIYSDEAMEAVIRLAASKAYDAALRDAVEALSPLIPDRGGDTDFGKGIAEGVARAVRVIEALVSTPDVIESDKEQHPHG